MTYKQVPHEALWLNGDDFLPEDVIFEIVSFLPVKDLFAAEKVSISWSNACAHIKWVRVLPTWKLAKLPPDTTYEQKREYTKREMKEFVIEKNTTKLMAKWEKRFTYIYNLAVEKHPIVDKYTFYTALTFATTLITLEGMGYCQLTYAIMWLIYLCCVINFTTLMLTKISVEIYSAIRDIGLGCLIMLSATLCFLLVLKGMYGSLISWAIILLIFNVVFQAWRRAGDHLQSTQLLTTASITLLALYTAGYYSYLILVYIPLIPLVYRRYQSRYSLGNSKARMLFFAMLLGHTIFSMIFPVPISWFLLLPSIWYVHIYWRMEIPQNYYYL
jgi:hypothetical protein